MGQAWFTIVLTLMLAGLVSFYVSGLKTVPVELVSVSGSFLITATTIIFSFFENKPFKGEFVSALILILIAAVAIIISIISAYLYHSSRLKKNEESAFGNGDWDWAVGSYFFSCLVSIYFLIMSLKMLSNLERNLPNIDIESDTLSSVGVKLFFGYDSWLLFIIVFILCIGLTYRKMFGISRPKTNTTIEGADDDD